MKDLTIEQMSEIEGGFPWASFASGALCAYGILTAATGIGLLAAGIGCGAAFLVD